MSIILQNPNRINNIQNGVQSTCLRLLILNRNNFYDICICDARLSAIFHHRDRRCGGGPAKCVRGSHDICRNIRSQFVRVRDDIECDVSGDDNNRLNIDLKRDYGAVQTDS
jgi:hypothetical protein